MDDTARARALRRCALFSGLPDADLQRLAASSTARRYRRGQFVVLEGDPGDSLLIVAEGSLKAVATSPHGEELLLAVLEPGESVGELTVADGGQRSATVAALTDATVVRIPRETVLAVAERSPALTRALLASLAGTVRRLTGDAADLVFLDTPRRVAKLLLGLAPPDGARRVHLGLTQSELAERVGSSRQTVNAALQGFQRRGWITVDGRDVALHDVPALRRFVG
ncbi:Crp/Fnr family transcriptional regulator [Geodermatophilus sp. SYSU D00766]